MQRRFNILRKLALLALAGSIFLNAELSEAARITQVKGRQVLIDLTNSDLQVKAGEKYFVVVDGKRKAVVTITTVKGKRAIGRLTKGQAQVNATLASPDGASSKSTAQKSTGQSSTPSFLDGLSVGLLGGFSIDSQSVDALNTITAKTESISMSGNGFSVKGFADLPIVGLLGATVRFGLEQFNVTAETNRGTLKTEITYITGDLLLRYQFMEGSFVPYVHAGLGIHYPASKKSDTLEVENVSATTVFFAGAGANYFFNKNIYMTAIAEYGLFPPSTDVKTNMIAIRAGLGYKF